MIHICKEKYDEWYFYDSCRKFISEIEFVYNSYENNIKDIYDSPSNEAYKYVDYLEHNLQELESLYPDDVELEIQGKGQERYYFVLNMKYRSLAMYINLIYQMLEQFLMGICKFQQEYHTRDPYIKNLPLDSFNQCIKMFDEYNFEIKKLNIYDKIDELRLLQNVLKHSEGESKEKLIKKRPDLFIKKDSIFSMYKNTIIDATLNISEDDLKDYVCAIKEFLYLFPDKLIHKYNSV